MGAVHGVCYGMVGDNLPSRAEVVRLCKSRNIHAMRIYNPDQEALAALRGSGIALVLDVGGVDEVRRLAADPSYAATWVRSNVQAYYPDVFIRYVVVGNEVEPADARPILLPAIRNVNAALSAASLGASIKATTSARFDVFTNSFPPSNGVFAQPYMADVARLLASTDAPLLVNVYPYFAYRDNPRDIRLNYATFQPGTTVRDAGNGLTYTCLFDAMVDVAYAALEKAGAPGVRVVVSESGWPSAGGFEATVDNARKFNQGLIDHVRGGTPRRPGPIETILVRHVQREQEDWRRHGEELWAVQAQHGARVPGHLPELTNANCQGQCNQCAHP